MATAIGSGALGVALLLRMTADTTSAGWLRWATPLGWAEELRPFTGARPLVLVLPVAATVLLLVSSARIARERDIGRGLLAGHDSAPPRLALLSSPTALALRTLRGGLIGWLTGIAVFALLMGVISDSVASGLSQSVQDQLEKLGTAANTASGYLGFTFLFFLLALSLFACFQLAAMREDEAEQRLETLLALPVRRGRWFAERLALVVAMAAGLALAAGALAWVGAASQGAGVAFGRMLEAGANCLPVVMLFLGLGGGRLRAGPPRRDDDRLLARRRRLPVGDDRRAGRRAGLGARPLAVPPRRPRPGRGVPGDGRARDDRHRRGGWARRGVDLRSPRRGWRVSARMPVR